MRLRSAYSEKVRGAFGVRRELGNEVGSGSVTRVTGERV